jgi:hypothetical protein
MNMVEQNKSPPTEAFDDKVPVKRGHYADLLVQSTQPPQGGRSFLATPHQSLRFVRQTLVASAVLGGIFFTWIGYLDGSRQKTFYDENQQKVKTQLHKDDATNQRLDKIEKQLDELKALLSKNVKHPTRPTTKHPTRPTTLNHALLAPSGATVK